MSFVFYPNHERRCPDLMHCPHVGGAALGYVVSLANENDEWRDWLFRQLDATREESAAKSRRIAELEERVKQLVSGIVKNAEHAVLNACFSGSAGKGLELLGRLLPQLQPFQVGDSLVGQLLAPRLEREVLLGVGDLRLAGITVLGNQVAGEPGELEVWDDLHRALTAGNRFAGAGKVMARLVTRLLT